MHGTTHEALKISRRRPRSSRGTRSKRAWQDRKTRRTEEMRMRTVLKAMLLSAGIALASVSGISAAPVNRVVIKDATAANNPVHQVQHWRWGSGGHWRWGSG